MTRTHGTATNTVVAMAKYIQNILMDRKTIFLLPQANIEDVSVYVNLFSAQVGLITGLYISHVRRYRMQKPSSHHSSSHY